MKKSEMTISMPLTTYEELMAYKIKLKTLTDELKSCFNTQHYDTLNSNSIDFSVSKALEIAKKSMDFKYLDINVNVVE